MDGRHLKENLGLKKIIIGENLLGLSLVKFSEIEYQKHEPLESINCTLSKL